MHLVPNSSNKELKNWPDKEHLVQKKTYYILKPIINLKF